jgi:hypothetical protein
MSAERRRPVGFAVRSKMLRLLRRVPKTSTFEIAMLPTKPQIPVIRIFIKNADSYGVATLTIARKVFLSSLSPEETSEQAMEAVINRPNPNRR